MGFRLQLKTRKRRVYSIDVGCSTEDPNPNFIALFHFYDSHFATRQIYLRYIIITMIIWLQFTINDEGSVSIFSSLVQSKTYNPAAGAVNIPVEGSYPFPSFRSTVPKTTRPFTARLLTLLVSCTSKATTFFSKILKRYYFQIFNN